MLLSKKGIFFHRVKLCEKNNLTLDQIKVAIERGFTPLRIGKRKILFLNVDRFFEI